jgi:hypothetical protein
MPFLVAFGRIWFHFLPADGSLQTSAQGKRALRVGNPPNQLEQLESSISDLAAVEVRLT